MRLAGLDLRDQVGDPQLALKPARDDIGDPACTAQFVRGPETRAAHVDRVECPSGAGGEDLGASDIGAPAAEQAPVIRASRCGMIGRVDGELGDIGELVGADIGHHLGVFGAWPW